MHVYVYATKHCEFEKEINPWAIGQACGVQNDGTQIEAKHIGVLHQWPTASQKLVAQLGWHLFRITVCGINSPKERLELGCSLLLTFTIVGIIVMEQPLKPLPTLWQNIVNGTLLGVCI